MKIRMNPTWKRYLLWFAQDNIDFRYAELESVLSMFKINLKIVEKPKGDHPYLIAELPSEASAKLLASRLVSLRFCQELWVHAGDVDTLHNNMRNFPASYLKPYTDKNISFRFNVETFCKHFSQKEKVEKIERFSYLPFKGPIDLKNPDVCFQYIEHYGTDANNIPDKPYKVFFGRWIANGLRQLIQNLSLKNRKFIGNTSMDAQMSLLMANQAKVQEGHLVLDPFVGSGSILVAAAQFGGYVFGTDIDYLMLHGKTRPSRIRQKKRTKDESILTNMKQYGLQHRYLDIISNDFSTPVWRPDVEFNSIITDPPYGIREATERIGTERENCEIRDEHVATHIPSKIHYGLPEIFHDLMGFSAQHLLLGGRLVCFFPVFRDDYSEEYLPSHPCLELVANSEEVLSKLTSRRLLTFEKVSHPNEEINKQFENRIADFRDKYFSVRVVERQERITQKIKNKENHYKNMQIGTIDK